ncbi:uncharacterized protein LOC134811371 [Bolinopsis microptera]|uniref:uncharacterized protein LOC134811371 n=1 Tax=Bolinopsis microptera TaxID=2820187 RepID=UPI00307A3078
MRQFMIAIALCLVGLTISEVPVLKLGQILQSPGQTLKLFSQYKAEEHINFGASENRVRFLIFKKNAQLVSTLNSAPEETAKFGLNFFSSQSSGEKHKWLGLNTTGRPLNTYISSLVSSKAYNTPKSVDWVKEGAVTTVKKQGSCGSCWAFGAVGAMESRYKIKSGRLRAFSEQEYLDCTFSQGREESFKKQDGCGGGFPTLAYDYSTNHGGRLAAERDYPYESKMGECRGTKTPNAAVALKIIGGEMLPLGESSSIAALAEGPIWIALQVTNAFFAYRSGVFKDTTCIGDQPNHGVTGVGYTETYVLIKNSWGKTWGAKGFMKVARNHDSCGLWKEWNAGYPMLEATGKKDKGINDKKSGYGDEGNSEDQEDSSEDDNENTACEDNYSDCKTIWCKYTYFAKDQCQKTCKMCAEKDGEDGNGICNPGLIRCPDGVCKHEHMC